MDEMKSWPSWNDFCRAADESIGSWAVQKGSAVGPSAAPKLTRLRKSSAVGKSETLVRLKVSLPTFTSPFVLSNAELFREYLEQEEKLQRAQARRAAMQGFEIDEAGYCYADPYDEYASRERRRFALNELIGSPPPGFRWVPGVHDEYLLVKNEQAPDLVKKRQEEKSRRFAFAYSSRPVKPGDQAIVDGQLVTITAVGGQADPALFFPPVTPPSREADAPAAPRDEIKPELLKKRVSEW